MKRRHFFLASAGGLAGFSVGKLMAQGKPALGAIGVQLYTLREMAKANLPATLAAVARAGYTEVEFAGYHGHPPTEVKKMLKDNGLTSPSAHFSLDELVQVGEVIFEDAAMLGQKYITCSWIDAKDRSADGYKRIADTFNSLGLLARGEKVLMAYHNHAYEFATLPGGQNGLEILIQGSSADNLVFEIDVFWMKQAGQDPLTWLARHPGRFRMMHVKDMGPPPKNEMLDVGSGTFDWARMVEAGKRAGVEHFFVEHDEPNDPVASITRSYRHLRSLKA